VKVRMKQSFFYKVYCMRINYKVCCMGIKFALLLDVTLSVLAFSFLSCFFILLAGLPVYLTLADSGDDTRQLSVSLEGVRAVAS